MMQTRILGNPLGHMRRNVVAYLALFVALGGTSAYAANEWTGANIVDESLTSADVKNGSLTGADTTNGSLTGADVSDGTLGGVDITNGSVGLLDVGSQAVGSDEVVNDSLLQSDIRAGAVTSDEVLDNTLGSAEINDNSLTGADINESTLDLPQTRTTATFAGLPSGVPLSDSMTKVGSKTLAAGSYAIAATANLHSDWPYGGDRVSDMACELRNGGGFIGGGADRRVIKSGDNEKVSLAMNGGAQVPAGGGEVSVWCLSQLGGAVDSGQMMIIRLDGFS